MPSNLQAYLVDEKTPVDQDWVKRVFGDIDRRIASIEDRKAADDAVIDELKEVGLQRVDEALLPAFEAVQQLAQLGVLLEATSTTTVVVGTGAKAFTVAEASRDTFAPASYLIIRSATNTGNTMSGHLTSYDRETGALVVDVEIANGSGSFDDWSLSVGALPDATHSGRTDNPHDVTAEQVGAYSQLEVDEAIAQSAAAIVNDAGTDLDTLGEAENRIVALEEALPDGAVIGSSDEQTLLAKTLVKPKINVEHDQHGDIYFRNASGELSRLGPGAPGHFLKSNGSDADPSYGQVSAGFTIVGEQETNSGSSIDVAGIPASATMIVINSDAIAWTAGALIVRVGDSSGIETTGYVSGSMLLLNGSVQYYGGSTASFAVSSDAASGLSGHIILTRLSADGRKWACSHSAKRNASMMTWGAGFKTLSGALDRVSLSVSGTYSSGNFSIAYI